MSLHVLTVATNNNPGMEYLLHSAEQSGLHVKILSMLNKNFQKWGGGFGIKMSSLQNYIQNVPDDDIILFIDAYDVIIQAKDQQDIIDQYLKFNSPIVISAEQSCASRNCVGTGGRTTDPNSPAKYVCSGAIIGRAGAIRYLLEENTFGVKQDDQLYWGKLWQQYPNLCIIDSKSELFISMIQVDEGFTAEEGNFTYHKYNTKPRIIHFNGTKKDLHKVFYKLYPEAHNNRSLVKLYGDRHVIIDIRLLIPVLAILVITIIILLVRK